MGTLAITAAVEPTTWADESESGGFGVAAFGTSPFGGTAGGGRPPRVRLDVTDAGNPKVDEVTVIRTDSTGRTSTVRTVDGGPLRLLMTGVYRKGVLFDYEAPFGQQVTYSLLEQPSVTATATVDEDRPWLIHPELPQLSMPVTFRKGSFEQEDASATVGVFYPHGRRNAVAISDGQRKAPRGTFTVSTETPDELSALLTLVDDVTVLLLNVPPALGLGIATEYVSLGEVSVRRPSDVGTDPLRDVLMPYAVAEAPIGGSRPLWGWAEVAAQYTWGELASLTWEQVLLGPDAP